MTFVQEGKLSLDDKVSNYIPLFNKYSKRLYHHHGIALHIIRELNLTSTSVSSFKKASSKTLEDEAIAYGSKREIKTNPGTEFNYSNIGYILVGQCVGGDIQKRIRPLSYGSPLKTSGNEGTTFTNEDYNSATDPFMGARSTANDLTNFMTMLMNKGVFNNKQVLTDSSVKTLLSLAGIRSFEKCSESCRRN